MAWIPIAAKGGLTLGQIIAGAITAGAAAGAVGKAASGLGGSSNVDADGNIKLGGGSFKAPKIRISGGGRYIPTPEDLAMGQTIKEVQKALGKLIGSTSKSAIRYKYKKGQSSNIGALKDILRKNPKFIEDIIDIVGKDRPKGTDANDIIEIISKDSAKKKALLDALKSLKLPEAPTFNLGSGGQTSTATDNTNGDPDEDPDDDSSGGKTDSSGSQKAEGSKGQEGTTSKPIEVTKKIPGNQTSEPDTTKGGIDATTTGTSSGSSSQPKDPKKDKKDKPKPKGPKTKPKTDRKPDTRDDDDEEDEDERKPPLPVPEEDDSNVTERVILEPKRKTRIPQQWLPQYRFGGQDLLRLTDTEKLEELRNYTLFDLVTPLLTGDEDNLLALQNKIQENRRFTNTYPNPRPEPTLPPAPNVESWRQPMRSVYPTPYPMSLDMAQSQNYYDQWDNQDYQFLNKKLDTIAMGGTQNPDLQKILTMKRDSYTATDSRIMRHTSPLNLHY